MNHLEYFRNFNIGTEIDLAGAFAYNALSLLNTTHDIYKNDQIFLFLYNAAVSVERMQKCVLFMCGDYEESDIEQFGQELKTHDHQKLQNRIHKYTQKKLSEEQNALLLLLQEFYEEGRYSNYAIESTYNYKAALEAFVKRYYGDALVATHFFRNDTFVTEQAKERIGRTLGKLLCYYYELVKEKAQKLNLYTYELQPGSPAEKVFLNNLPKKSLQAISESERNALAELIVYLVTTTDSTGYLNYIKALPHLPLDPYMVQEYLVAIMNREIPQSLVDEVATLYEDMTHDEITERKEGISIIGESNVFFAEDVADEDFD